MAKSRIAVIGAPQPRASCRPNDISWLLVAFALFALPPNGFSQPADSLEGSFVRVTTLGREIFQGTLYSILDDRVELVLADGRITQNLSTEIESIELIDVESGRQALFQDAATNRLMVMPTGFPMEQGEFHVTDQEIIVVTGSYGVSDNLSVWAGISIPGLILSGRLSFFLGPGIGASAGVFAGVEWFNGSALLLPYALLSFGTPNRNVTAGGAAVLSTGSGLDGAVFAVGGRIVLTATSALVTENWFIWNFEPGVYYPRVAAIGLSFRIAGNRLSWDLGAVVPIFVYERADGLGIELTGIIGDALIPLPLISVTYRID